MGMLAKRGDDRPSVCASGEIRPERTYRSIGDWVLFGELAEVNSCADVLSSGGQLDKV
jgi:hypothetical protein